MPCPFFRNEGLRQGNTVRFVGQKLRHVENLPAATKRRMLRRDGWFVLHDVHTPEPVDLAAYCAGPHMPDELG
jgi:hypothetical protein